MKLFARQHGMTLVELLVAVAILAVGIVPLMSLFTQALKTGEHANKRMIAMNLARDLQEEIRSKAFWEPDGADIPSISSDTAYFPLGTTAQPFGLEEADFVNGTDTRYGKFDDVDDYDHWCRGKECDECPGTTAYQGRCVEGSPLQSYDGELFQGTGYAHYYDFTRSVRIFNILPNISTLVTATETRKGEEAREHVMKVGGDDKAFHFFDIRDENLDNLRVEDGTSRLKVIRVTVKYTGPVTPPVEVEDIGLVVLPIREE